MAFWGCFDNTDFFFFYRVSLLGAVLLDPAELSERQLGGDGGGQRKLVVGTSCSLQFQAWWNSDDVRHER